METIVIKSDNILQESIRSEPNLENNYQTITNNIDKDIKIVMSNSKLNNYKIYKPKPIRPLEGNTVKMKLHFYYLGFLMKNWSPLPEYAKTYTMHSEVSNVRQKLFNIQVEQNGLSSEKRKRSWNRAVFSNLQRKGLEKQFEIQKYITKPDRKKLAARLNLSDSQVKVWFQNRRMKERHKRNLSAKIKIQQNVKLKDKSDSDEDIDVC
uniref:CSON005633 protein n=1 Tax=Culicoides sonorensis TaxID=179676 RepID=A0A336LNH3_CULSO